MQRALRRAGIEERWFDTGEVKLHYVAGPKHGPPLVLIPGQSMSWESYQRVLPGLSRRFEVFAVSIRGHGRSGWTPGGYTLANCGRDLEQFLWEVVKVPAIVSGNSSGGLLAVWLAARVPELVRAIVPEDPPLFSAEWPRLRDDCWAYRFFERAVTCLGGPDGRDLGALFAGLEIPTEGSQRLMRFPRWAVAILSGTIRLYRLVRPSGPLDLPFFPTNLRVTFKCMSEYDPDFTRAFLDGAATVGFDHAALLSVVRCPMLLLHAHSFRHPELGLVGSMDKDDVARIRSLVPEMLYRRLESGHVVHLEQPRTFIEAIERFVDDLPRATLPAA